jgi:hypothetical protein
VMVQPPEGLGRAGTRILSRNKLTLQAIERG